MELAYMMVSNTIAERRVGSNPTGGTKALISGSFEVVPVDALFLAGTVTGRQELQNVVEEGLGDQALVASVVLDAVKSDLADVVAVTQEAVESSWLDLTGRLRASWKSSEAFGGQCCREVRMVHSPLAYASYAHWTSAARSGSGITVRISRPSSPRRRALR
jgi:hypothetical protein